MRIARIGLRDFRNYRDWELEPDSALTVLTGPNAVGKTNILEAIQIVATGASFRNPRWEETIGWGAQANRIQMTAAGEGSYAEVELIVEREGRRSWRVGGAQKRRAADVCRFVPVVLFTPDDLALVKGPAEQRRAALDSLGEQLSTTYGALRRDYARVVRQRNTLLRSEASQEDLDPWDRQLVSIGARLHVHRRRLAHRLFKTAAPIYAHLAHGECLDARMCDRCGLESTELGLDLTTADAELALETEVKSRRSDEAMRRVSLAGPHRDDLIITIDGRDARGYASQGQQRTIALAWKWAEVAVIQDVLKRAPVLLLDDVMSELDQNRRRALTDMVLGEVQTFMTTTNTGYFDGDLLSRASVVELGSG